jgi:hypothetical protein
MRKDKDLKPSCIVKKRLYTKYVKGKYLVDFTIDDDPSNTAMWHGIGIPTMQKLI